MGKKVKRKKAKKKSQEEVLKTRTQPYFHSQVPQDSRLIDISNKLPEPAEFFTICHDITKTSIQFMHIQIR